MTDAWIVVGVIAYAGDTALSVWSSEALASAEADRMNARGRDLVYDDGYEVRGPFAVDGGDPTP